MTILPTKIDGLYIIRPKKLSDSRGYFFESHSDAAFKKLGLDYKFIQDNQSYSTYGTIRDLHFQREPYAQAKLVRVISGKILDVAVDLRMGSPSYGKYVSAVLDDETCDMLMIPRGFAHGFSVLSETAIVVYKVDNIYNKETEGGILYSDPEIKINWGIPADKMLLSDKDKQWPALKNIPCICKTCKCK
jgi:dTDP-4-dehydrorhamnose 3,5-epimerase